MPALGPGESETRRLASSCGRGWAIMTTADARIRGEPQAEAPLLVVDGLAVAFGENRVVDDLSFTVRPGQTVAIVGESGSGKSMTSLSVMRLADTMGARYPAGRIVFEGRDLLTADQSAMRRVRGKEIAMIFQEPMTSLNPVFTIGDQIAEVLILHEKLGKAAALKEAQRLLEMVRLPDAAQLLSRYPHQLSGGMRQRIMIAMALACRPKLLIADEPTTALDVTIQAQILSIMRDLQRELGMGMIFITHDMGVVAEMADEVVVMWKGRKMEEGPVGRIFAEPEHPYTRTLLSAVPRLGSMTGENFPKRTPLTTLVDGKPQRVGSAQTQDTARYDGAAILSVENLFVRFDVKKTIFGKVTHRAHAVSNVSFDIFPGETLALVGESGSGKSTIGRTIQQLQTKTSGDIRFAGKSYESMTAAERFRLRRDVQYIF